LTTAKKGRKIIDKFFKMAMKSLDPITGLSINGKTYKEGVAYKNFHAPTFLLDDRYTSSTAAFTISRRNLEVTYFDSASNTVGKLAAKGKATLNKGGNIAQDFKMKKLMEVSYRPNPSSRELKTQSIKLESPTKFNESYELLVNKPRKSQQWAVKSFDNFSQKGIPANPFTDPVVMPLYRKFFSGFNSAFKNDWWSVVLPEALS
jgi:hypothetical protein